MRTSALRPGLLAVVIAAAAQALFTINLWRPTTPVFDEVHYLPAARAMLALSHPVNVEHPLLGKALIATGIALFGDTSIGWRAMSTLAGTASVVAVFWIVLLTLRRPGLAALGAGLAMVNGTVFIQARIAMLDAFMAAFVLLGVVAMLWAARAEGPRQGWGRWILGAVLLGLATGVKWTAAPYVAFAALAMLAIRRRHAHAYGRIARLPAVAVLGIVSVATYLATFAPAFFYAQDPLTLARLIPFQWDMFRQQTQILPSHPYQSDWWTWPLMIRPIWYLYEPVDGAVRGILLLGNPVVMWGGLVAVAALLAGGVGRRDGVGLAVALLWVASLAIWAAIPKSLGFYYYYHLSGVFLCVAIPVALARWRRGGVAAPWVAVAALGGFVWLYPIQSAAPLPDAQAFNRWMLLDSWR